MFCVYEGDHMTLLNVYKAFIRVSPSPCQPVCVHCVVWEHCVVCVPCLYVQYNKNSRWCQENFLSYKGDSV